MCNSACLFTLFWMNALVYEFVHSFLLFGAFTDVLLTIWCCSVSEHAWVSEPVHVRVLFCLVFEDEGQRLKSETQLLQKRRPASSPTATHGATCVTVSLGTTNTSCPNGARQVNSCSFFYLSFPSVYLTGFLLSFLQANLFSFSLASPSLHPPLLHIRIFVFILPP